MTMNQIRDAIRTIAQTRLAEAAASIKETPWAQAVRNVRRAWCSCSSTSVARAMLRRYPHCYLVNADFASYPRVNLLEYRTLPTDHVPLVRVTRTGFVELIRRRRADILEFEEFGATLVEGDGALRPPTSRDIILSIAHHGWRVLTVDDARCILEARDIAEADGGYLTAKNRWLPEVDRDADGIGIAESLFPFCEQVIETRSAIIVVYTPGLPRPLRLWRLSLKWIMPSLPPVA
jgi:hypothetical protein